MTTIRNVLIQAANERMAWVAPRTTLLEIADVVGELVGATDSNERSDVWREFIAIVDAAAADTHEQRKSA